MALTPSVIISQNMSLPVPVVGQEFGPQWAIDLNSCLALIDTHDHSSGEGVPVTPNGLNINADLPLNGNNLTLARSLRMVSQATVLTLPTDLLALYSVGVDLYYNDGNGNNIQITQNGAVAGASGNISGLVSPASASYVAGTQTFVWQSDVNTAANMDMGSIIIREVVANAKGITISSPSALSANYTIALPSALPSAQKFVTLDSSGNLAAPWAVDNATLEIASGTTLRVKDAGITAAKLASDAVTAVKILDHTITVQKRAIRTVGPSVGTGNLARSTSCGTFTTTSTSAVNVTNLSVTLPTTGNPVYVAIVPDGSGSASAFAAILSSGSPSGLGMQVQIKRDTTVVAVTEIFQDITGGNARELVTQVALSVIDPVAAGTYTYTVQISAIGGTAGITAECLFARLIAYEI